MDDASLMRRSERFRDLLRDRQRFGDRKRPPRDALGQLLAFDQFHDEHGLGRITAEAVDLGDVRVIQRGKRLGFPPESSQAITISCHEVGQDFQCDLSIQDSIACAVDLAHPTRTKQRDDFVWADAGPGGKRHVTDEAAHWRPRCGGVMLIRNHEIAKGIGPTRALSVDTRSRPVANGGMTTEVTASGDTPAMLAVHLPSRNRDR